jgi:hypothetical protein
MTSAMENEHDIWNFKHQGSIKVRFTENSGTRIRKLQFTFGGSTEDQMEQGWQ